MYKNATAVTLQKSSAHKCLLYMWVHGVYTSCLRVSLCHACMHSLLIEGTACMQLYIYNIIEQGALVYNACMHACSCCFR